MEPPPLLPVPEAVRAVLDAVPAPRAGRVPLEHAVGRVLAAPVLSDLDMPPFAKSMMDGYAVRSADVAGAPVELRVVGVVHAGVMPTLELGPGEAAKIMTGAPVPDGADSVVMVEKTDVPEAGVVRILEGGPAGRNVTARGLDARAGREVLPAGKRLGPADVAVLAAVGVIEVPVFTAPRLIAFTTGDEVVPPGEKPGPGRIRNSNSPALLARARADGADAVDGGNLPDDMDVTRGAVASALGEYDLVVLTGGVSMGDKDLVGAALAAEGLAKVFHKIRLKPGKPMLFGTAGRSLVFGLPGNPVSVAVTYEILVRPVIRTLLGLAPVHRPRLRARLVGEAPRAGPREQYLPALVTARPPEFTVRRVRWNGSADLFGFAAANALLVVPPEGPAPSEGDEAEVMLLDDSLSALIGADGEE